MDIAAEDIRYMKMALAEAEQAYPTVAASSARLRW